MCTQTTESGCCSLCGLQVEPFASLAGAVRSSVPRQLINRDLVGPFAWSRRPHDVAQLGDVVSGVRALVDTLGWTRELDSLMTAGAENVSVMHQTWKLQNVIYLICTINVVSTFICRVQQKQRSECWTGGFLFSWHENDFCSRFDWRSYQNT